MIILEWTLYLLGGIALAAILLLTAAALWCAARDQRDKFRSWWRARHAEPGLPQDGWLSWEEQEWLKVIEAGYGDAPKALLRRLR